MIFTLIAYKESYTDHYGDRHSSDLKIECSDSKEDIAKKWAELTHTHLNSESRAYDDYEYTLLIDGMDFYSGPGGLCDEETSTAGYNLRENIQTLYQEYLNEFKDALAREKQKQHAENMRRNAQIQEAQQLAAEKAERLEFERLSAKYGKGPYSN